MAVEHGSGRRIDEKIAPSRGPMVRILERTVLETNKYGNRDRRSLIARPRLR